MSQRKRRFVWAVSVVVVGILATMAVSLCIENRLASAAPHPVGPPPTDIPFETVRFASDSGSTIHGWFVEGQKGTGAVILMHQVRSNRLAMVPRARFLWKAGFSVLLFDFQAHGESPGQRMTFGHLESRDARAAVSYVRSRLPEERVGAIGASLGGAALLVGPEPVHLEAIVLEAAFPTFAKAVDNRLHMRLGCLSRILTPLFLLRIQSRLGFSPDDLRPIDGLSEVNAPLLIVAGADDQHTTLSESRRLYDAAHEPKDLWVLPETTHVDFYGAAGTEYERRILAFLSSHLGRR